jgi:hypothetical protein
MSGRRCIGSFSGSGSNAISLLLPVRALIFQANSSTVISGRLRSITVVMGVAAAIIFAGVTFTSLSEATTRYLGFIVVSVFMLLQHGTWTKAADGCVSATSSLERP